MSDDGITLEVFRTRHHPLQTDEDKPSDPVRFPHLTAEQAATLQDMAAEASPSYSVQVIHADAPPTPKGKHRRPLGGGAVTVPPVPNYSPSIGDTDPAAAWDLGQLITDLTDDEPEPEAPAAVRFDVDLVYKYRQADESWTPARTHQATLFARDQEMALRITGNRLLHMLRRAGYLTHVDHLEIISGTTRAGA